MTFLALNIPNPEKGGAPISIGGGNSNIPIGDADKLSQILQAGFSFAIIVGILFCLYVLIMSGRQYMMSGGDKEKMERVRHRLSYAVIGLVLIFLSYFIVSVLTNFFGFTIK